jgi:predicted small lipoprotein YifL
MRMLAIAALAALAGCGASGSELPSAPVENKEQGTKNTEAPAKPFPLARCARDAMNCAASMGRVIYIESVDPDGDGDLHVVAIVTKGKVVTGAGITVFDVSKHLRPKKDPRLGAIVTGAGPVYRGSHGQDQIEVTKFRVQR